MELFSGESYSRKNLNKLVEFFVTFKYEKKGWLSLDPGLPVAYVFA